MIKIKTYELMSFVLILSLVTTPYTAVEIAGLSFAQITAFLLFFMFFYVYGKYGKKISINNPISRCQFYIIVLCAVAMIWMHIVFPILGWTTTSSLSSSAVDFIAYTSCLLSTLGIQMYIVLYMEDVDYFCFWKKIFLWFFVLTALFYGISRVQPTILGYSLFYAGVYFTPLASNLHHTSMVLAPIAFIGVFLVSREQKIILKILYLAIAVFLAFCAIETGSSKAVMSIYVGVAVVLGELISRKTNEYFGKRVGKRATLVFFMVIVLLVAININSVVTALVELFVENDGGGGRATLYSSTIPLIFESPIWGRGFGAHIGSGSSWADAHNSILAILLQGGIVGFAIYMYMWVNLVKKTMKVPYITGVLIPIIIYSIGGDTLRRLPCWMIMILVYYTATALYQKKEEIVNEENTIG